MSGSRLVAVLGYSNARGEELHDVCANRLRRAELEAQEDDVILLSGWARGRSSASEAELMARSWSGLSSRIVLDRRARSTLANVVGAATAARALSAREVVLVTSSWHGPRAAALLRAALRGSSSSVSLALTDEPAPLRERLREAACWLAVPLQGALARNRTHARRHPDLRCWGRADETVGEDRYGASPDVLSARRSRLWRRRRQCLGVWSGRVGDRILHRSHHVEDELRAIGDDLTSSLSEDGLKDAAESVSSATDTFIDDVRGLGRPDTESGQEVESSLDRLSNTLETEKADIEQTVDDISGLTGIPSAVTAIVTSLTAMSTAFQTALESIEDADVGDELQTALEDSDACADLSG